MVTVLLALSLLQDPKPRATGESLAGEKHEEGDLVFTEIAISSAYEVPVFWSDGKSFLLLEKSGLLRRIGWEDLKEEIQIELETSCAWISPCGEGVLVTPSGGNEIWILDLKKLELRRRIEYVNAGRAISAAGLSLTVIHSQDGRTLTTVDLKKGAILKEYEIAAFGKQLREGTVKRHPKNGGLLRLEHLAIVGGGKYLLGEDGGCLNRFRIGADGSLAFEEAGPEGFGRGFPISPDGQSVLFPIARIEQGGRVLDAVRVHKITDLATHVSAALEDPLPIPVGWDKSTQFWGVDRKSDLVLMTTAGKTVKKVPFGQRVDGWLPSPDGKRAILRSGEKLYRVGPK